MSTSSLTLPCGEPGSGLVMVGMSGGVDSSVAALRLLQSGYRVAGLFMKNWEEDDGTDYCTAQQDLEDAARVCDVLDIELHTANFAAEYWDNVFENFLAEYRAGRTPNPDVLCNREIKFNVFLEYARLLGAERVATGHYARLAQVGGETHLLRGIDPGKDQSYFLHAVPMNQLAPAMFPLGELEKTEVREMARSAGLHNHERKDSTGICFIGERRFADFLTRFVTDESGPIVSTEGRVLGEHQGLSLYTLGQRQGLGIGGRADSGDAPWYVAEKDLAANALVVAQGGDHPALHHDWLIAADEHWIGTAPELPAHLDVKIRYRQSDQRARLQRRADGALLVSFDATQRGITPGQFAVFYDGDRCLGGARIAGRGRHASRQAA